jgi:hypothetical protein
MERKYTIVAWDGKVMTFARATCKTENGEYVVEDLTAVDVHYGFPMANVFYVKEELCD